LRRIDGSYFSRNEKRRVEDGLVRQKESFLPKCCIFLQLPQQLRIRSCFVVIGGAPERQRLSDMIPERLRHDIISAHENPRKNLRKIYEKSTKNSLAFFSRRMVYSIIVAALAGRNRVRIVAQVWRWRCSIDIQPVWYGRQELVAGGR